MHSRWTTRSRYSYSYSYSYSLALLLALAALHGRCVAEDVDSEEISGEEVDDDGRIYKNPRNSPSAFCPRDEELAELLKHKCLRKCSTDEDCKSKKKKCLCDGACGMSCIKPERECEELASPSFGAVSLSGRLFGDIATYTCEHGYHIVGLAERVCQADGNWSGQNTLCKHNIFCRGPPQLEHARHSAPPKQVTFDVDTALEYRCHHGYDTDGFPQAKCLYIDGTASWYGPDISCHPRSCGTPDDIAHGWHAGECYTYGCRVSYHCAEGFELVGRKERLCQPDGQWNPHELPSCVPVECPTPEHPANGKAIYTSTSYNSVVTYECKYGFTLAGEATRRCGADRKWSGHQAQCKEINCGHPGVLHNGWIENVEAGFGLGASLIYRCQDGMLLLGNSSSVCQVDGTWRYPPPQCLAPCVVPGVQHGRVELLTRGGNGTSSMLAAAASAVVPHGERLSVRCNQSYEFLLASTPVACSNGTWTHMPRCEPARCKRLPKAPRNGMVIAPKNDHGMLAKFQCRDGYTLKGIDTNVCQFGNWTGDLPFCQEVYCPFPGYLDNGKVMLVGNMGLYDYRPYVRKVTNNKQIMYDCDKGYVLEGGPPGATCIGGQWSPRELPKCVPGLHPRIRWSRSVRAKRALMMGNHHQRTHQTLITRQRGRRPGKGRGSGQNRKDRNQKGKATPCDVITNEAFATVEIVKVGKNSNLTYSSGTVVRLVCAEGYHSNLEHKNSTARCTARGVWKPIKPECLIIPCRIPESEHGIFILSHLEAEEEMSESLASLSAPPIPEDPAEPRFGDILEFNSSVKNGQLVEFSCRPGFKVKGVAHLKCWHGRWQSPEPSCSPAPCELPVVPGGQYLGGYRAGLTIADGSSVHFQCENDSTGGSALPPLPVECVLGELRPFNPECGQNRSLLYRLAEDLDFKGGSDITKGGLMSVSKLSPGMRRSCGPPARVQGSLVYRDGQPIRDSERSFPDRTEVTFNCIASFMGEKTTWRIVCEDGSWVGRSLNCDGEDLLDSGHQGISSRNATCRFRNSEPNVVSFYNDQQITEDVVEFPPGSVLVSRCVDIGKYALIGARSRGCVNGDWDGQKPVCFGLNQENDYALEKPPTILFRHQLGPIAQSNDGKLVVYPGTILHMECLWIRRFGTPKWNISHEYSQEGDDVVARKYPEGWTTDPGRDSQLEYRLSIYHASKDDSGVFTCITPTRHTHSVEIDVQAVHCPTVPSRRGLILSSTSTKMNTRVLLSCANGNSLIGAPELTCLPSGNWSAPVPICESIECADLVNLTDPHLRVSILSREVGGRAVFSCAQGFGLDGPNDAVCQQNGDWSMPLPTCQEVQCETPPTPENGYIQGSGPYKAGDVVQFNCNPEFMMDGQPIVACQENGRWSRVVPKCVPACSYPGTTISGRMSAVKFYYHIGETISFTCDPGLVLRGAHKLRCLRNGKWSNAIPTCIPPDSTSPDGNGEEEKKEEERDRDRDRERGERNRDRERRRKVPVEVEATSR